MRALYVLEKKRTHIQVHRFKMYFIHKLNGLQRERKKTTNSKRKKTIHICIINRIFLESRERVCPSDLKLNEKIRKKRRKKIE